MDTNRKTPPFARLQTHTQPAPRPLGLTTLRAAHTAQDGRVFSYGAAYSVENGVARLVSRWHPGQPIPAKPAQPDPHNALARHANVWERAQHEGAATVDNPKPARPDWRDRRRAA